MTYHLGGRSRRELKGVHPTLISIVEHAIEITKQDFTVVDGLRTEKEQREYVRRGVSRTMHSRHLPQIDGYSHAVDLVPYVCGILRWETVACCVIAQAIAQAAYEKDVNVKWGGCWKVLYEGCDPEAMVYDYVDTRRAQGRSAFIDAAHYQLEI